MGRLTLTSFVSLDGVMQSPGAPHEDPSGDFRLGGWVVPFVDEAFGGFVVDVFSRVDAFLLGRSTWEIFAGHWPRVTDPHDPVAAALNTLPKYVATRTLTRVDWAGSSIVRDAVAEASRLASTVPRELQVHGSPGLARSLLAAGAVDELNLLVFPVLLGRGKRLFDGEASPHGFTLVSSQTTPAGAVLSRYRKVGPVAVGAVPPPA